MIDRGTDVPSDVAPLASSGVGSGCSSALGDRAGCGNDDGLRRLEDARVLLGVLLCLGAHDMTRLSATDTRRAGVGCAGLDMSDAVWCHLCEHSWKTKSTRYHLTPERARELAAKGTTWQEHYKDALADGQRDHLRTHELLDLRWAFNFTPLAGGRGSATMQFVEFRPRALGAPVGQLIMMGYPPLPYCLSDDGKELDIAGFPIHYVKRLPTWEWEITNRNVTFVSCVGDDVQYSDRNFKDFTADDLVTQAGGLLGREAAEELLRSGEALPRRVLLFSLLHDVLRGNVVPIGRGMPASEAVGQPDDEAQYT